MLNSHHKINMIKLNNQNSTTFSGVGAQPLSRMLGPREAMCCQ